MDHEFESQWKQLGSLANGVLRSVMEKRMKAEMMEAAPVPRRPANVHPAHGASHAQLELPLFSPALRAAGTTGRELHRL